MHFTKNILQEEIERRCALVFQITSFFMLAVLSFLPATLFIPNPNVKYLILSTELCCAVAQFLNYKKKPLLAGSIVVGVCEIALALTIISTNPFRIFNLPLFDLFTMASLLAVTLIPARAVFLIATLNSIFIFLVLLWHPLAEDLQAQLSTDLYNAWIRPSGLQFIAVGIAYILVRMINKFILKYYHLQMHVMYLNELIANLQHSSLVVESKVFEQQKSELFSTAPESPDDGKE